MTDIRTKKFTVPKIYRGSQLIYGERQHLRQVLESVRNAKLPRARKQAEVKLLTRLVGARTEELNRINPGWDRKYQKARDAQTSAQELLRIVTNLSAEDYLLARALTEHAEAPSELLERLASHRYAAVRENIARHPHTPVSVLQRMADDANEPLWFLVACNPSTPSDLRDRLRARMQQMAATSPT